jgi:hypothetical protein
MMSNRRKTFWLLIALVVLGCSTVNATVEKGTSPTFFEPSSTLTQTASATDTPSATHTEAPSPNVTSTPLPYTMLEIEKSSGDLASVLYTEAQKAQSMGRRPYIQIVADWCPACRALLKSMKDERMIAAYRGTYILLADIDVWRGQLPDVDIFVSGVPAIYELTYAGTPTGRLITGAAWGENTPENMAPPLDEFFHPE